jgi:hypothetical protein
VWLTAATGIGSSRCVGFLRRFGWVAGFVLALALQDGCASDLPAVPGEESGSGEGEGSSSDVVSTSALDTSTGEPGDTVVEPGCGNGILEAGETCDDQGQTATCDEDCTPVDCGERSASKA